MPVDSPWTQRIPNCYGWGFEDEEEDLPVLPEEEKRGAGGAGEASSARGAPSQEEDLPTGPDSDSDEEVVLADSASGWVKVQVKTFLRWVNVHLEDRQLKARRMDLDWKDGRLLCHLLELLAGGDMHVAGGAAKLKFKGGSADKIESLATLEAALGFVKAPPQSIKLVNIGAADVYEGNLKLILGLVWTLIQHYQVQKALDDGRAADLGQGAAKNKDSAEGQKNELLRWMNAQLEPYAKYKALGFHQRLKEGQPIVSNFTTDWQDGKVLAALTDSLDKGIMDISNLGSDPLHTTQEALEVCEDEFGFPHLVDAEDLVRGGDENSLITYLAYFRLYQAQKKLARGQAVAKHCFATGPGLASGAVQPGQATSFTIFARDRRNRPRSTGGETFTVSITSGSSSVSCQVVDQQNGTYLVSYTAPAASQTTLTVNIALKQAELYKQVARPIKGSPMEVLLGADTEAAARAQAQLTQRLAQETANRAENKTETAQAAEEEDDEEEEEEEDREESEVELEDEEEEALPELGDASNEEAENAEKARQAALAEEARKEEEKAAEFARMKAEEKKKKLEEMKRKDKEERGDPLQLEDGSYTMPDGLSIIMPYGSLRWGVIRMAVRYESKTQKVLVKLFEARKLLAVHGWRSKNYSNPYVKMLLQPDPRGKTMQKTKRIQATPRMLLQPDPRRKTKQKTKIHKSTVKPVFNSKHVFHILEKDFEGRALEVAVWDKGVLWNSLLGHVLLPLKDLDRDATDEECAQWYALMPRDLGGLNHSGSIEFKDCVKYPDGSVLNDKGQLVDEEGKELKWDHKGPLPGGGRKRLRDATVAMWDGTIMLPTGALTRVDGNLRLPDGTIQPPKWLLESVLFPRGVTQAENFDFYVDGRRVVQPKLSNTCPKHGLLKVAVRYHPAAKQIEVDLLEARGLRSWSKASKPRPIGEVQCELVLLPRPADPAERKRLTQHSRLVKPVVGLEKLALWQPCDFNFQDKFTFNGTVKPGTKGNTLRDLKESTLHVKVFQKRVRGRLQLGHLKFNLAAASSQPFQWHAVQPFSVHRPRNNPKEKSGV
eukprot:g5841.t1